MEANTWVDPEVLAFDCWVFYFHCPVVARSLLCIQDIEVLEMGIGLIQWGWAWPLGFPQKIQGEAMGFTTQTTGALIGALAAAIANQNPSIPHRLHRLRWQLL